VTRAMQDEAGRCGTMPDDAGRFRPSSCVWVDPAGRSGFQNMAIDHALLEAAVEEQAVFLRLYRWNPACLSFGYHEPAARRYGRQRVEALELPCVRRPTGGRAVWHARELTYAYAAPERVGGLREVYRAVHGMLVEGLRALGVNALLAAPGPRVPGPSAGACFATPVGGEVVIGGAKVVGSAQVRRGGGLLQHGSLLLQDDQRLVHELTNTPQATATETTLSEALGRVVTFQEAADAIRKAAERSAGGWGRPPEERVLARAEGHLAHYRDPEWTWRR